MNLISLLVVLALLGLVAWCLTKFVPMPEAMRSVIIAVAVIFGVLYALSALGVAVPVVRIR